MAFIKYENFIAHFPSGSCRFMKILKCIITFTVKVALSNLSVDQQHTAMNPLVPYETRIRVTEVKNKASVKQSFFLFYTSLTSFLIHDQNWRQWSKVCLYSYNVDMCSFVKIGQSVSSECTEAPSLKNDIKQPHVQ